MTRSPRAAPETPMPQALATVTDRLFFEYLLQHGPDTRTNIAEAVGLSRPTASEAALRLSAAGLVTTTQRPAGQAPVRRGRIPDFYDISSARGHTLALAAASGRATARSQDVRGTTLQEVSSELPEHMTRAELEDRLRILATEVVEATGSPCLAATASQGNPVDPGTQRPVALPDAPFPEGLGDLPAVLRTVCDGPVRLDNDVNWATLAEHRLGAARGMDDAVLFYLGPGVGAGVLMSGVVQRGRHGTAGELGYLRYGGRTLMSLLLEHGVASPGGERLDTGRCRALFAEEPIGSRAHRFVDALAGAIGNITTFMDPQALVVSGPLSHSRPFVDLLRRALRPHLLDGEPEVLVSQLGADAPLLGAGLAAREMAQEQIWSTYRS